MLLDPYRALLGHDVVVAQHYDSAMGVRADGLHPAGARFAEGGCIGGVRLGYPATLASHLVPACLQSRLRQPLAELRNAWHATAVHSPPVAEAGLAALLEQACVLVMQLDRISLLGCARKAWHVTQSVGS
jgi:hypothetical protein